MTFDLRHLLAVAVVALSLAAVAPLAFFSWIVLTATPKKVQRALKKGG